MHTDTIIQYIRENKASKKRHNGIITLPPGKNIYRVCESYKRMKHEKCFTQNEKKKKISFVRKWKEFLFSYFLFFSRWMLDSLKKVGRIGKCNETLRFSWMEF